MYLKIERIYDLFISLVILSRIKKSPVFTLFVFFAESWPEVDYQRLATQGRWRSDRLLSDGPEQFWHSGSRHGLAKEREEAKPGHPHGFGWKQMWPRTLQVVTITKTILMETRERGWWQGGVQSEHLFVEILFQQLINCKEYQILKLNNKRTHTTYHTIRVFN